MPQLLTQAVSLFRPHKLDGFKSEYPAGLNRNPHFQRLVERYFLAFERQQASIKRVCN